MKKFEVEFEETTTYNFIVEAENEDEAEDKAYDVYDELGDKKYQYFNDCDGHVIDVSEVE